MRRGNEREARSAAVLLLFAIMLVPFMGMMAFAIDAGYTVLVEADLQNAADAAALGGAEKLQGLWVQYYSPGQPWQNSVRTSAITNSGSDSPMATAERFASYNKAGSVNITVPDADVSFGYLDGQANYTSPYSGFPNTIQVVVRRDNVANGPLRLFFGGILGMFTIDLTATSRATIYQGSVSSLKSIPGVGPHILPVALSPDGTVHLNPVNNLPELQVYPSPGNAPGQFGLLDVGPSANNVPAFRNWIDDGSTPNDISYLLNNHLLPVSMQNPEEWKGGPGLKSTLLSNFQSEEGVPNLIPLFQAVQYPSASNGYTYIGASGSGQGSYYAIVGFVGVTISDATGSGGGMNISVQPAAVVDPSALIHGAAPAGTQPSPFTPSTTYGTTTTTFVSAKLTY